jgi:hypothetical protein
MVPLSFTLGLISGFTLLILYTQRSKSRAPKSPSVIAGTKTIEAESYDTPLAAAKALTAIGQVVWISDSTLNLPRVHNTRVGATVEEAIATIDRLSKLSPTTVVVDGVGGLEASGSNEETNAVVEELSSLSGAPVFIFPSDGNLSG